MWTGLQFRITTTNGTAAGHRTGVSMCRLAAVASLWIAAARSLIPGEAVLDAMRRLTADVPPPRSAHDA